MERKYPSSFSVLLLSVAAAAIGVVSLWMLNIQYTPSIPRRSIRVSYSYPDASARTVEAEVTSKLEGVLSCVSGVSGISSTSSRGGGRVTVRFRKGTDMLSARYEVASLVRNIYDELPDRLGYPEISLDASGSKASMAISYEIRASLPTLQISHYAEEHIVPAVSRIEGVDRVGLFGATPFHYVILFDAQRTHSLGIKASEIASAIRDWYKEEAIGLLSCDEGSLSVVLSCDWINNPEFEKIPICTRNNHLVYLRDIATWRYEEAPPDSYFRVNGLNTLTLSVSVSGGVNLIKVASDVEVCMSEIQMHLPKGMSIRISYDSSEYVRKEIQKILCRTALCLIILLLFVALTSHSFHYTLIVGVTIMLNLLVSLAVYSFSGLALHIYTLAGISVSLGIIIDNTIVMVDHYRRSGNKAVFPAILGAVATTVGALLITMLLPESERKNLTDFIIVIIINLSVSLLVAWFFVPAILDAMGKKKNTEQKYPIKRLRRLVAFHGIYESYIIWGIRHRWLYVVFFIIAFGLPLCLIPPASELKEKTGRINNALFKITSWAPYANNRQTIDKIAGSCFALFHGAMDRVNLYREPVRTILSIHAGMLEGASVSQLNDVVKGMENYLSQFDQIELFTADVRNYNDAEIRVYFKKGVEGTTFPYQLKTEVTTMATNFGGANWRISGVDDNYFNNNIVSSYRSSGILLRGYNYDALLSYAESLRDYLSVNRRVSGAEVRNAGSRGQPEIEYNISYDEERRALAGIGPNRYYRELSTVLYSSNLGRYLTDRGWSNVSLQSSDAAGYDLWHVNNESLQIDSLEANLSTIGSIGKRRSGLDIIRKNQSYELEVAFDFIGSYELQKRFIKEAVARMNKAVLPVGYKAEDRASTWSDLHKDNYLWLILLIILVIYVITAITLESFRLPLSIIWMIPISFIGAFLVFGLSDLTFDQGGLASFIMLSGLSVNAGIYIISEWKTRGNGVREYVKAFVVKITPILLTLSSTIIGLLPFLSDGPKEVFWFDFAIGTISGMVFSIVAIVFYLPVFAVKKVRI